MRLQKMKADALRLKMQKEWQQNKKQYFSIYPIVGDQLAIQFKNMPYIVKTQLRESQIHGKGVYALEKIPKGTVDWVYEHETGGTPMSGYDVMTNIDYTEETFPKEKDEKSLKEILHGGYHYQGGPYFIYLRDGSQFTNHVLKCNSQMIYPLDGDFKKSYSIALNDIEPGEEITQNYQDFLTYSDWILKLMEKYCPDRYEYEEKIKKENKIHQENI